MAIIKYATANIEQGNIESLNEQKKKKKCRSVHRNISQQQKQTESLRQCNKLVQTNTYVLTRWMVAVLATIFKMSVIGETQSTTTWKETGRNDCNSKPTIHQQSLRNHIPETVLATTNDDVAIISTVCKQQWDAWERTAIYDIYMYNIHVPDNI